MIFKMDSSAPLRTTAYKHAHSSSFVFFVVNKQHTAFIFAPTVRFYSHTMSRFSGRSLDKLWFAFFAVRYLNILHL